MGSRMSCMGRGVGVDVEGNGLVLGVARFIHVVSVVTRGHVSHFSSALFVGI
jgi:hypothetical protein